MAKGETDKPPLATTATAATPASNELTWEKTLVAEDEISILWKETARIETLEQASEAARQTQTDNFWPQIEALADHCDRILVEHGFPKATEMVRHDGAGKWWRPAPDSPRRPQTGETWKFTRGEALAQEFAPDFSDPWYAGRIGKQCRLALAHYQKGDAGEPFLFSKIFSIATLRADWQWRHGHKPSILTGQPVRKGAKLGGEMRAGKYKPETAKVIQEMQQRISDGMSVKRSAELVAKQGIGTSAVANRKLWSRHKAR